MTPLRRRMLARAAMLAPELSSRAAGSALARSMDAIAAGQAGKR